MDNEDSAASFEMPSPKNPGHKKFYRLTALLIVLTLSGTLGFIVNEVGAHDSQGKLPRNCAEIEYSGNGTPMPVVCEDGTPNLNAEVELREVAPQVMQLQSSATEKQIQVAICTDVNNSATYGIATAAYGYKMAMYGWAKKYKDPSKIWDEIVTDGFCDGIESSASQPINKNISMEERYRQCVDLKQNMSTSYLNLAKSLLGDDAQLWTYFVFTNSILEDRRGYLSQRSKNLISAYKYQFDSYQILQCELNFPILKEPVLQSNGQQEAPWYPSAIV